MPKFTVLSFDDLADTPEKKAALERLKQRKPEMNDSVVVIDNDTKEKRIVPKSQGYGMLEAIPVNFARGLLPSAATYGGMAGITALTAPPATAGGAVAGPAGVTAGGLASGAASLLGGIGLGMGTEYGQQKLIEKFNPELAEKLAITEKTHPYTSTIGRMASGYPYALNNPMVLGGLAKAASTLRGTPMWKEVLRLVGKPAAINMGIEAGMQGVTEGLPETGEEALQRAARIGMAGAAGATQITPTRLGEAVGRMGGKLGGGIRGVKAPVVTPKETTLNVYKDLVKAEAEGTLKDPAVVQSFQTRLGNDLPIEENVLRAKLRLEAIVKGESAQQKKETKEATKEPGAALKEANDLLAKANDADKEIEKLREQLKAIPATEVDLINRTQLALAKAKQEADSIRRTALEKFAAKFPASMEVGPPEREARYIPRDPNIIEGEIVPGTGKVETGRKLLPAPPPLQIPERVPSISPESTLAVPPKLPTQPIAGPESTLGEPPVKGMGLQPGAVSKFLQDFAPGMRPVELYQRRGRTGESLGSTALNHLKFTRPFGLDVNDKGELPIGDLVNRMNNLIPPDEVEWYRSQGLESFLKSQKTDVSAKDFADWQARMGDEASTESFVNWRNKEGGKIPVEKLKGWMESVAPKVSVSKFGGQGDAIRQSHNLLRHDLETNPKTRRIIRALDELRPGESYDLDTAIKQENVADPNDVRRLRLYVQGMGTDAGAASAQWHQVTAKSREFLSSHDYTELSVNIPGKTQFTGQHRPFPENTVGHSRGWWLSGKEAKEFNSGKYGDLADDAKVFWIEEVQSDWGQQRRELLKKLEKQGRAPSEEMVMDNPLLPHSNRIAVKATIKHALDNGADAVVISDPETVMMTEGHDQAASMVKKVTPEEIFAKFYSKFSSGRTTELQLNDAHRVIKNIFGPDWQNGTYVEVNKPDGESFSLRIDKPEVNKIRPGQDDVLARELSAAGYGQKEGVYIPQQEGMNVNYGMELPKIMRELTGVKGERVSGGTHEKTGFYRGRQFDPAAPELTGTQEFVPRENLIFKNPDGTPKTDASGLAFNLNKVRRMADEGANFSLLGNDKSFYSGPSPQVVKNAAQYVLKAPDWAIKYLYEGTGTPNGMKGTMPLVDRIRGLGPEGEYIADKHLDLDSTAQRIANRALRGYSEAFKGLTKAEMGRVERFMYDMDDIGESSLRLTDKEQATVDKVRDNYQYLREEQNIDGPLVSGREGMINPDKVPHLADKKVYAILHNQRPGMPEYDQLHSDWVARQMRKLDITAEKADKNFQDFMKAGSKMDASDPAGAEFAAVREAEGIGLPDSWRAPLSSALTSHAIRSAKDLSWYRNIQKDPRAAKIMGIKDDGRGTVYDWNSPEYAQLNDTVSLADKTPIQQYNAEYNIHKSYRPDLFDRWTSLGNSMLIGPKSAIRDLLSTHGHLAELMPGEDLPTMLEAWKNVVGGKLGMGPSVGRRMEDVGAIPVGRTAIEFQTPYDFDSMQTRLAHWARVSSGRDALEKTARQFAFETGRLVGRNRLAKGDMEFFNKLKLHDWKTMKPEDLMDQVGMKFVEGSQGKYSASGLPASLLNSAQSDRLRTFLNLQRWGVERFNNWYKSAWRPAVDKGEFGPLLRGVLGNLASAGALRWIEEELFNAKPSEMTWKEWLTSPNKDVKETAYTVFNKLQVAGYGGILSSLISAPIKALSGEGVYGMAEGGGPGMAALADVSNRLWQFTDGVGHGRIGFIDGLGTLVDSIGRDRMQFYRLMKARDERDLGKREERMYRRQTGQSRYMDIPSDNPFDATYALRKARTVPEIEQALPAVESAYRVTGNLPQLQTPIRQLEPSGGRPNFYQWLSTLQGAPAAQRQWQTDVTGDQLVQAKRRAVEEIRRRVAASAGPN